MQTKQQESFFFLFKCLRYIVGSAVKVLPLVLVAFRRNTYLFDGFGLNQSKLPVFTRHI